MTTGQKIGAAVGLLLIGGGIYAKKLYDAASMLQPDIASVGTPKVDGTALIIPMQVLLRNPSQTSLTIDYPTVKIYQKDGTILGTTKPKPEKLTIKSGSDTKFPAELRIGATDLAALIFGKFKDIKTNGLKGQTILLDVMTGMYGYPINFTGFEKTF